ncbi:50S ribosomal protein L25 [Candidatus Saccharibacteria bacterium]|nr:50S ribosomal protein L25 [Candidatus Saccharibacteria bacterium]
MSQDITVELEKREILGKGLNKLRAEGNVPCVIHDHGKDSIHTIGNYLALTRVYKQAGKHHAVQIKLDGKDHLAIIKHVDFDPKKNQMRHVVFQAIKQNEKIQTEVPIVMEGDVPAELSGLMVITHTDHVSIEAFPKDLPDQITVNANKLVEIGDKLHISDLKVPEGVTILVDPETTIAVVEETKAQMSEESGEETVEDGGEEPSENSDTSEESTEEDK